MEHVRKYFRNYLQEIKEKDIQDRLHMMMELLYSSIVAGKVLDVPMHITGFEDYNLYYMSPSYMELAGYSEADVFAGGFPFLYDIILPEDLVLIKELKANLSTLKLAPLRNEAQCEYSVHFNYRIRHKDGSLIHLECRMLPVGFIKDRPNFLLAYVRKTEDKFKRKFEMHFFSKDTCYVFDIHSNKFVLQDKKMLKEIEIQILELVSRGARESTMVKLIGLDINMIKYHKKNIMKKLSVQSMNEALYYALKNNIL